MTQISHQPTRRRRRQLFLREAIADVAGAGYMPSADDLAAIPEAHRARVREIASETVALFHAGDQQEARERARAALRQLEPEIERSWAPGVERPDPDLITEIRGEL